MRKIVWFAKGGGIAKCGPFETQIEATNAMRLAKRPNNQGLWSRELFPNDIFVWPEYLEEPDPK